MFIYVYIFRSRHSLSSFSFCIRHASTFPCSQCLQPPRRTASRDSLHQREAYVYVCVRARRLSLHRLLHTRARLPFLSLAPSDVRAGSRRAAMLIKHSRACSLPSRSCMSASTHCLTRADSEKCAHFPLPVYISENFCMNTLSRHKQYTVI